MADINRMIEELDEEINHLRKLNPSTNDNETKRMFLQTARDKLKRAIGEADPDIPNTGRVSRIVYKPNGDSDSGPEIETDIVNTFPDEKKLSYLGAEMETLTCESCGNTWERQSRRGRKPRFCSSCNWR